VNKETKTKLISRIGLVKSKSDLTNLMENAANLLGELETDAEIQKAVKDKLLVFNAAAAAARAAKPKPVSKKPVRAA